MDTLLDPTVLAVIAGGTLLAAALYVKSSTPTIKPRERYGILVENTKEPGATAIIRNWRAEKTGKLVGSLGEDRQTLYDLARYSAKHYGQKPALGTRSVVKIITEEKTVGGVKKNWSFPQLSGYQWTNYADLVKKVDNLASGLIKLGMKPRENLAIYSETCAEWTIAAHAAFTQSMPILTIYANLGLEPMVHALGEGEIRYIVTNLELLSTLVSISAQVKTITTVIVTSGKREQIDAKVLSGLEARNIKVYFLEEVVQMGEANPVAPNPPKAEDLAVIMYTSGSTGMPKGLMLTHTNCVSTIAGTLPVFKVTENETYLSYLPLAHILAFIVEQGMLALGNCIGYGSPRSLTDNSVRNCKGDITELKPTFFVGVPTIYEKIKSGIQAKLKNASPLQKTIFETGYQAKKAALAKGTDTPFWNTLVFNKFKEALGGRVRFMVSGGASMSPESAEFLNVCFGCPLLCGYGLTETCGGSCVSEPDLLDLHARSAGAPNLSTEIKLVDVPEMGYTSEDKPNPRGEIWIRGFGVSSLGYYKNEQKTKEDFTADKWFKTGDIGCLNPNYTLSIIDRKKNLIKPPHGEYIAPERLEGIYRNADLIDSIMVHADPYHNQLLALVHPKKVELLALAKAKNIPHADDWEKLIESEGAEKLVLANLAERWKTGNLRPIERIHGVKLFAEEWTPDNGWMTAAMKLRRQELQKVHEGLFKSMFAKLPAE